MIRNEVECTTTSTASPYTLSAVSGAVTFAQAFAVGMAVAYEIVVEGGPNNGNREWGRGFLSSGAGAGTVTVTTIIATLVGSTYTQISPSAVAKTGATTIRVYCWPAGELMMGAWPRLAYGTAYAFHARGSGWNNATTALIVDLMYVSPIEIVSPATYDAVVFRVNAISTAANAKVAVYSVRSDGTIVNRIAVRTSAFAISVGVMVAALDAPIALPPGIAGVALIVDGSCDVARMQTNVGYRHTGFNTSTFRPEGDLFDTSTSYAAGPPATAGSLTPLSGTTNVQLGLRQI